MKIWSFYDPDSGLFTGRRFIGGAAALEANTPAGTAVIEGAYDRLSQRVDLETGEVVDYRPERPSEDHEWDNGARRWALSDEAADRVQRDRAARRRIAELEARQLRPMRELVIDAANDDAREKLEAIEAEIARLRNSLKAE